MAAATDAQVTSKTSPSRRWHLQAPDVAVWNNVVDECTANTASRTRFKWVRASKQVIDNDFIYAATKDTTAEDGRSYGNIDVFQFSNRLDSAWL